MIAPKKISLTIDGKACTGEAGQTILDIARAHDITIPTLCHLKGLTPWGGCRLCIVEIEGSPKTVPSCATPAVDGSKIITNSERLHGLRKATLELLFSERNHICPMCQYNKGDCGLQHQGMVHGISGIRYQYLYPALPVDLTAKYFGQDHNRCILCTRCVRTCDEMEGVHTLDVAYRGIKNRVVVDMNQKFGESLTCTACGACVANCPTGSLFDKATAFRGQLTSSQTVLTTCTECPLGCGLKVFTKENRIVNVFGDPDSAINNGHLCVKGRYETWAEPRERITQPLVRRNGQLVPVSWDEAVKAIKTVAGKAKTSERALLVSPRLTNEAGQCVKTLDEKFHRVGVFVGHNETALCGTVAGTKQDFGKLKDADAIILLGVLPTRDNGVLAAKVRTQVRKQGAKLVVLQSRKSDLDLYADVCANIVSLERGFWKTVATALAGVKRPVLVCGPGALTPIGITILEKLTETLEAVKGGEALEVLTVPVSPNAVALTALGLEAVEDIGPWVDATPLKLLHIVASDEPDGGARLLDDKRVPALLSGIDCVVVQAGYRSALTEQAAVVLPTTIWCEKSGTVTNCEGTALPVRPVLPPTGSAREDKTILESVFA